MDEEISFIDKLADLTDKMPYLNNVFLFSCVLTNTNKNLKGCLKFQEK